MRGAGCISMVEIVRWPDYFYQQVKRECLCEVLHLEEPDQICVLCMFVGVKLIMRICRIRDWWMETQLLIMEERVPTGQGYMQHGGRILLSCMLECTSEGKESKEGTQKEERSRNEILCRWILWLENTSSIWITWYIPGTSRVQGQARIILGGIFLF